jgi:hypothetical protein
MKGQEKYRDRKKRRTREIFRRKDDKNNRRRKGISRTKWRVFWEKEGKEKYWVRTKTILEGTVELS